MVAVDVAVPVGVSAVLGWTDGSALPSPLLLPRRAVPVLQPAHVVRQLLRQQHVLTSVPLFVIPFLMRR